MLKLRIIFAFALLLFSVHTFGQKPEKPSAVDIYNQIQKLNFLGSVLYIAAHPDDENTRLISYFANEKNARTGYLSLTRGDGGQNLIGHELRELLGVIRTQELIEARKIDGGEQFFSRANDFGYSKTPDETLAIWNKDSVLADMVYIIRKFRPDIIINRFDARTPGTTHGHHTASAMLSLEAFDKTGDASAFASQLNSLKTWQPTRIFYNTSWWAYGKEKFEKMDKSHLYQVDIGVYYPTLGMSNQEIAALSRSCHQSQGFGATGTRGNETEYLELIKGSAPESKENLFAGIDTSWNRVKNGKPIGDLLEEIQKQFDFRNPSASIPDLVKAYSMIQRLDDLHWKTIKSDEIKQVIAACAGLYLEAVAEQQKTTPGNILTVELEAINRSPVAMQIARVTTIPATNNSNSNIPLQLNKRYTSTVRIPLPKSIDFTQPYWLTETGSIGMYRVSDQSKIGVPDVIRKVKVNFDITIAGITIPFTREVIYKYNDDAKGEVYEPFDIVPDVTTTVLDKVAIFPENNSKQISVIVKAGRDNVSGNVRIQVPPQWKVSPASIPFAILRNGGEETVVFNINPPTNADVSDAKIIATVDGQNFDKEQININYPHISKQVVLKPSEVKLIKLDIKTGNERIAYIMGAGDEIPKSLAQMGYSVTPLTATEITKEKLAEFDVVMTGIRAYNTLQDLAYKQQILFDFVSEGNTMIVQYNTLGDLVTPDIAPYPLKISRERVTEENAEVQLLEPSHPLLNYPNKITPADFHGWKQEQGLYYPNQWGDQFTPLIASADKGESLKKGALLVAQHGKGRYIYTGLSFFRELPEGVPGAFRLMANLISQQKTLK